MRDAVTAAVVTPDEGEGPGDAAADGVALASTGGEVAAGPAEVFGDAEASTVGEVAAVPAEVFGDAEAGTVGEAW